MNKYQLIIDTVNGETYRCDPFECSEERFEEIEEQTMQADRPVVLVRIKGKSVRFQVNSIVCMWFEEV